MFENSLITCKTVLDTYLSNKCLQNVRFIIVQHMLSDTFEFMQLLQSAGSEIFSILFKPYSIDKKIFKRIGSAGIRTHKLSESEDENKKSLSLLLNEAIEISQKDKKQILILDLGGEFAPILNDIPYYNELIGVIEDTTFGHKKYQMLYKNNIPIISVARSPLKEIEAKFVGEAVVDATEDVLKSIGKTLCGRNVLVVGYGMIGRNVASSIKKRGSSVYINDISSLKMIQAYMDGYVTGETRKLVSQVDIIIGATGTQSVSYDDIVACKDGIFLVSASSRDIEFDLIGLNKNTCEKKYISKNIDLYFTRNKKVFILNNGTPINFLIKSVPNEIIDLVFAEILYGCVLLLSKENVFTNSKICYVPNNYLEVISEIYLKNRITS